MVPPPIIHPPGHATPIMPCSPMVGLAPHKDPELCPVAAMGQLLVARFCNVTGDDCLMPAVAALPVMKLATTHRDSRNSPKLLGC